MVEAMGMAGYYRAFAFDYDGTLTQLSRPSDEVLAAMTAKPLPTSITQAALREAIFNERLYEFIGEAKRRQDMVRAGTYTNARLFKQASSPYRILMPIPQNQIETNPLLKQNPGY